MNQATLKFRIKFNHPITAYSLEIGGWLPLAFTSCRILLVDRNILSILSQLSTPYRRDDLEANDWWISFLNTPDHIINPILYAMEGNSQAVPSFDDFCSSFRHATKELCLKLPKSHIINYEEQHYRAAYAIVQDLGSRYEAEQAFLLDIAPHIAERSSYAQLSALEKMVFAACKNAGLSKSSLVVLAALSCLYEKKDGSEPLIGRNIIKPAHNYDLRQTHNALSDLRALEVLIAVNALNGGGAALCTRDKYLAAFWCSLRIANATWQKDIVKSDAGFGEELFPRLNQTQLSALVARLREEDF